MRTIYVKNINYLILFQFQGIGKSTIPETDCRRSSFTVSGFRRSFKKMLHRLKVIGGQAFSQFQTKQFQKSILSTESGWESISFTVSKFYPSKEGEEYIKTLPPLKK